MPAIAITLGKDKFTAKFWALTEKMMADPDPFVKAKMAGCLYEV